MADLIAAVSIEGLRALDSFVERLDSLEKVVQYLKEKGHYGTPTALTEHWQARFAKLCQEGRELADMIDRQPPFELVFVSRLKLEGVSVLDVEHPFGGPK